MKLSGRVSMLSSAAQGDRLAGQHASPCSGPSGPPIGGQGHAAAIELILARAAAPATPPRDRRMAWRACGDPNGTDSVGKQSGLIIGSGVQGAGPSPDAVSPIASARA